jgi:hypothetical protein
MHIIQDKDYAISIIYYLSNIVNCLKYRVNIIYLKIKLYLSTKKT